MALMEVVRRDMLAALSVWKSVPWAVYARMRQLFAAGVMVLGALHTCVVDVCCLFNGIYCHQFLEDGF